MRSAAPATRAFVCHYFALDFAFSTFLCVAVLLFLCDVRFSKFTC